VIKAQTQNIDPKRRSRVKRVSQSVEAEKLLGRNNSGKALYQARPVAIISGSLNAVPMILPSSKGRESGIRISKKPNQIKYSW
jgi:hypothetical protein